MPMGLRQNCRLPQAIDDDPKKSKIPDLIVRDFFWMASQFRVEIIFLYLYRF